MSLAAQRFHLLLFGSDLKRVEPEEVLRGEELYIIFKVHPWINNFKKLLTMALIKIIMIILVLLAFRTGVVEIVFRISSALESNFILFIASAYLQ